MAVSQVVIKEQQKREPPATVKERPVDARRTGAVGPRECSVHSRHADLSRRTLAPEATSREAGAAGTERSRNANMAVANNLSWRRRHERPHSDNPRRTCQRTGTCPRARHATLACHRHRFRLPSTSFWRRRFRMTSLTSNPVKRPHTDQAQVEVPADPDMVVRGKRLQPRLCSRIGAPPTPVVRSPPRGHATPSRRRPPASTATCRPPSARLPTSVRTQAPARFRHRRVIPRQGWRTRGLAVPSAQHPVRARRWRDTGPRG